METPILSPGSVVNEGTDVTVTADFSDPAGGAHACFVDFGNGQSSSGTVTETETVGNPTTGRCSASHTYKDDSGAGTFTVTVTVTSNQGPLGSNAATLDVNNEAPVLQVPIPISDPVEEGTPVTISAAFTDAGFDSHECTVEFGDGRTNGDSEDETLGNPTVGRCLPVHTYEDSGSFTVDVTVTDDEGASDRKSSILDVINKAPVVEPPTFSPNSIVDEGTEVTVSASFSDPGKDTHTCEVDFGDGQKAEGTVTETLGNPTTGTCSATHTYRDDFGTTPITVSVTVIDDENEKGSSFGALQVKNTVPEVETPTLAPTLTEDEGSAVTVTASFTDLGADTHHCTVDFGDGHSVEGIVTEDLGIPTTGMCRAEHIYEDDGGIRNFTVIVTVTDDEDAMGSNSETIEIFNKRPEVDTPRFSTGTPVDEGMEVTVSADFSDPGRDEHTCVVDFGDGHVADGSVTETPRNPTTGTCSATHKYEDDIAAAMFTVSVMVADDEEATGFSSAALVVKNVAAMVEPPTFSSGSVVDEGTTVTVSATFSDPGRDTHTCVVAFGDGQTAEGTVTETLGNPTTGTCSTSHIYADDSGAGTFTVSVTVTDDEGKMGANSAALEVKNVTPTVNVGTAISIFVGGINTSGFFTDPSADTWTATVDYGDGSGVRPLTFDSDKIFRLGHPYSASGSFTLTVMVTDDDGGVGSGTLNVTVTEPPEFFSETAPVYEDRTRNGFTPDDVLAEGWYTEARIDEAIYFYDFSTCAPIFDALGRPRVIFGNASVTRLPNGGRFSPSLETDAVPCTIFVPDNPITPNFNEARFVTVQLVIRQEFLPSAFATGFAEVPELWEFPILNTTGADPVLAFRLPVVTGQVFEDHNGDGVRDPEDQPIVGQQVCIADKDIIGCDDFDRFFGHDRPVTDSEGNFFSRGFRLTEPNAVLKVLSPEIDDVLDTFPSEYITTDNAITISFGGQMVTRDIGIFKPRTVTGLVYEDLNGNGMRDAGEVANPNLAGTNVFLDTDRPCINFQGCVAQTFGAFPGDDGNYSMTDVGPGVIRARISDVAADFLTITEGEFGYSSMMSGVDVTNADFGVFQNAPIISGQVFDDGDASGNFDSHDDRLLKDVQMLLDLNDDGTVDRSTITDEFGVYSFLNIPPGTHRVRQVLKPGAVHVLPADPDGFLITPMSNQLIDLPLFGMRLANDIVVTEATRVDATRVMFEVTTDGRPGPFQVGLYQSANATFDAADVRVGNPIQITPTGKPQQGSFTLPRNFRRDPARPNLIVVADPGRRVVEVDEANNTTVVETTADIAITSAKRENTAGAGSPQIVTVMFDTTGNPGAFDLGLYRSADRRFDDADLPQPVAVRRITPAPGTTTAQETFNIGLYVADPARPFLIVAADPGNQIDETDENNNASRVERVIELAPLQVEGTFTYNEPIDRFEANGQSQIGFKSPAGEAFLKLVDVFGSTSYDANTIRVSGLVNPLGPDPLFRGSATIDIRSGVFNEINRTTNEGLSLAGQPLAYSRIALANPGGGSATDAFVGVQGRLSLPVVNSSGVPTSIDVLIEDPAQIKIGPAGLELAGRIAFPRASFNLFGLDLKADDVSVEYLGRPLDALRIRGKFTIEGFYKQASVTADLFGIAGENYLEFSRTGTNLVGAFSVANIVLVPNRWELKSLKLSFNTVTDDFRGEAELKLPLLPGNATLLAGIGVRFGELNFISVGVDRLNRPTTNPAIFLQKVQAQLDNIVDPDPFAIELRGTLGFTSGPEFEFSIPGFIDMPTLSSLARLDLTGKVSGNRLAGAGNLTVLHPKFLTGNIEAELNFAQNFLQLKGFFTAADGALSGNGTARIDLAGNITMYATGALKLPRIKGTLAQGQTLATGTAYLQFKPDGLSNDYLLIFGAIDLPVLGRKVCGVRFNYLELSLPTLICGLSNLQPLVTIPRSAAGFSGASKGFARGAADGDPNSESYMIDAGTEQLLLSALWENDSDTVQLEIVAPDGTIFTEANFDTATMAVIAQLSGLTARSVGILNPAPGVWTVRVVDPTGLGEIQFRASRDSAAPTVEVTSVAATGTNVTINFNAADADSDAAVGFFYDTDGEGFDGVPIGTELLESDGAATAPWDTSAVPDGAYFIYAMIDDGNNAPVFDYLGQPVTIDHTAPAVTGVTLVADAARRNVQSINVTFDEAIAPGGAAKLANYVVRAPGRDKRLGTGDDVTVPLRSATLDPAANSVRLVPMTAQKLNLFFQINVLAKTDLTDVVGNALAADAAPGVAFSTIVGLGTKLRFVDPDGDTVSLALTRGGLVQLTADSTGVRLRLDGTTGASTLSGTVKRPRRGGGDGMSTIQSITSATAFVNRLPASIVVNEPSGTALAAIIDELLLESDMIRA